MESREEREASVSHSEEHQGDEDVTGWVRTQMQHTEGGRQLAKMFITTHSRQMENRPVSWHR